MRDPGDGELRGCMGAFRHLFHFSHPPKHLSPPPGCHEAEAPNQSAEKLRQCGGKNEEKRMAMQNVNVVARLMGLDRMEKDDDKQWRSSSVRSNPTIKQLSLSKSRSVNTLSEALNPLSPGVEIWSQKLHLRSHSFREHPHPQDKQLQEFKRDFEATQRFHYRDHSHPGNKHNNFPHTSDGASVSLLKDTFTDTPGKRQNQSEDFMDALDYLRKNEKIFLRAFHDPNSFLSTQIHSQYTRKASSQEYSAKELRCPRISSPCLANQNQAIPLHSKPSKNCASQLLSKIVVLEPNSENAKQTDQQLKTYKEFRFSREIPQIRETILKEKISRKASQQLCSEKESSGSVSSLETTASSHKSSAKGKECFAKASRISRWSGQSSPAMGMHSSPRFRKEIRKEEDEVSARKLSECLRDSDKKKLCSKPCSVTRRNRNLRDRIAAGHSSSGKFAIASSKKRTHQQKLMSKMKSLNEKNTLTLANYKDTKTGVMGEKENALANDVIMSTKDVFLSCPVANRVYECEEVMGSTGEKCEFPSPISVLDGQFQQESPSPVNIKEFSTDFHEPRAKLCSVKLSIDDTTELDQYGYAHNEEDTVKLASEDRLLAPRKEMFSDERSHLSEMQSSMLQSLKVDNIIFPEGKEANLLYVRNVLVSAGFHDSILAFTRWYSPSHLMDPQLFYRLEKYYHDKKSNTPCMNSSSANKTYENSKDVANRKILFDLIDEILCKRVNPFLKNRVWLQPTKRNLQCISSGKQLLKEVWDEICRFPEAGCEILEDVEFSVHRDMGNEAPWAGDDEDIEKAGFEVEQHIFDNLLQEAVFDFLSVDKENTEKT